MNNFKPGIFAVYVLALLVLNGCKKDICEEFDLNHETMEWHFFPDLKDSYDFYSLDSNKITFIQTLFSRSSERKVGGIQRACYPDLKTSYVSDTLQLAYENIAFYDGLKETGQSSIYYNVDEIESVIDVEGNVFEPYIDNEKYFKEFEIEHLDTLTLNNRPYSNLIQFKVIDNSKSEIEYFWIQQKNGIIGFQVDNGIWLK